MLATKNTNFYQNILISNSFVNSCEIVYFSDSIGLNANEMFILMLHVTELDRTEHKNNTKRLKFKNFIQKLTFGKCITWNV